MKGNNKENSQNAIGIVPIDTISLIFFYSSIYWLIKFYRLITIKIEVLSHLIAFLIIKHQENTAKYLKKSLINFEFIKNVMKLQIKS